MILLKPKFEDTEWFYIEPGKGYALKDDAPADVKEEFEAFMKAVRRGEEMRKNIKPTHSFKRLR